MKLKNTLNIKNYLYVPNLIEELASEVPLLNSQPLDPLSISVSLDRLDFYLPFGIERRVIENRFIDLGIMPYRPQKTNFHFLGTGGRKDMGVKFVLDKYGKAGPDFPIRSIHTNPSHFESFKDYFECLSLFVSRQDLASASISALHEAFDIKESAEVCAARIDVKFKSIHVCHQRKGNNPINNKTIGKRPHIVSLYADEDERPGETRLEVQVSKQKPPKKLSFFKEKLLSIDYQQELTKSIDFYDVNLNESPIIKSKSKVKHIVKFLCYLQTEGFYGARKQLGPNWKVSLKDVFELKQLDIDLARIAVENLSEFMGDFEFKEILDPDFEINKINERSVSNYF